VGHLPLGAERSGVTALVMRGAVVQALVGLAIGIPAAILGARAVASQLYGIKGIDGEVLAGAGLTLLAAAAFAGLIPARRAASIDPARALRTE
jgi:ABC-type antimicrobial peptide transport system permease subunit